MRHLTITLVLVLIVAGQVYAQFPNWGWAPPISIDDNGSSITCTVTDPKTGQTKTRTETSVSSYIYKDGVLAWVSGSRTYAMVYDYNTGNWEYDFWSATDNLSLDHGIVAVQSATRTYLAIYDPITQDWEYDFWTADGTVINNDGIVAFQSSTRTYAAVYDASLNDWKSDFWTADGLLTNNDGIVAFQSDTRTYVAAYDPVSRNWESDFWTADGNLVNRNGVVAFQSATRTYAVAYDPITRDWESDFWIAGGSLSITDGTVYFGSEQKGYRSSSTDWRDNENTDLVCRMFVSESSGDSPLITYLTYLAVGASSNNYNCGDGHQISSRYAWKQFDNSGSYNINLTVYNNALNNTCSSSVTVTGNTVSVNNVESADVAIYPNPTTGLFVIEGLGNKAQQVRVYNSLGVQVEEGQFISGQTIDLSDKPAGIYYVRVDSPKDVVSSKLVKR